MIDWRYLTTIPEFVPYSAVSFRDELWLAGNWGEADRTAGRSTYAPVVKVGYDGSLSAMRQWPEEADATSSSSYSSVHSSYEARALAVWQDRLWVGRMRRGTPVSSTSLQIQDYGLSSFDGDVWLSAEEHLYNDLLPFSDRLVGIANGAMRVFDGWASEQIAQNDGVSYIHLGEWADRLGVIGPSDTDPLRLDLIQWMWEASLWQTHRYELSWTTNDFLHAMHAVRPWVYWRGSIWSVLIGSGGASLVVWDGAWRPIVQLTDWKAPNVVVARNRLLIYETVEANTWSYPQIVEVDVRGKIAEYDGRTVEAFDLDGLAPYLVIPLDDGDAVAFCRSEARTAFLEANIEIGRQYGPTEQWKLNSYPDADTHVYVIKPRKTRPPIVPFGSLEGTVDDGADPIEAALVQADVLADGTDAAGDYAIDDMPVGRYTAVAGKSGYEPETARVSIEDQQTTNQDFSLSALTAGKCMVYGRVLDAGTRRPLYGATVAAGASSTTTDADGSYSIELDPGIYDVEAELAGYLEHDATSVTLTEGDAQAIDFYLIADDSGAGTVYGWVIDLATGLPVEGAVVALGTYEAVTDEDGYYSRAGIPAGLYTVGVSAGYIDGGGSCAVPSASTVRSDWGLIPTGTGTGTLDVTVEDADGAALEGATVTVEGAGGMVTGASGFVTIDLPAGTYIVYAQKDGYKPDGAPATVVESATTELTLTLQAVGSTETRGWLWGIVRDVADGAPLEATVAVAGDAHADNEQDTTCDAAGFYLIEDLWPGEETVEATRAGYHDQTIEHVPIGARMGTRLDIALTDTGVALAGLGTIAGYVFDALDHSRVARALVTLNRLRMAYSDVLGDYQFEQVSEDVHHLDAEAKGFEPTHVVNVPVAAQETTYCDLPLRRRVRVGRLVVVVLDEANEWLEDVTVLAGPFLSRRMDAEGMADFAEVPDGWYSVVVYKDGYVPGQGEIDVAAGGTSVLRLTLVAQAVGVTNGYLLGYVYDLWSLRGLQYATVDADGISTTAGQRGYYTLELPAGGYEVTGSLTDYRGRTVDATVAANKITRLDIPLLPDVGDEPAQLFVGVPSAESIPEGGPASVLIDYPEDESDWQLGVTTDNGTSWRRCQRVAKGVETLVDIPGEGVRILAKKVSGTITPPAASLRP